MSQLTLKEISQSMRSIDICMMTTISTEGVLENRPMSNNREVEYSGESFFFTFDHKEVARSIASNPNVSLGYVSEPLLGKNMYITVIGQASLVKDKAEFKKHWRPSLDAWFKQGVDTPGLVMIRVVADRVTYWHGMEEGTLDLGTQQRKIA